ncbi:MAG: DUF177 domain-containing protein [Prochlorococcaceae cyanobacterium]
MSDPLRPVPLQELQHLPEGRHWQVDQHLTELATLTPVRGQLSAVQRGSVLAVAGEAATIITLCCDRCLQDFNHPLRAQASELIWLGQGPPPGETPASELVLDLDPGTACDNLDPRGSFDPEHWLFEQLSLQLPLVNRCGANCPGPAAYSNPPAAGWSALASLLEPPEP